MIQFMKIHALDHENLMNNPATQSYSYSRIHSNVQKLMQLVKSKSGAARLGSPAAAGGKPVCDAPCQPLPPGREPGPCGAQTPAGWVCVESLFWHLGQG